MQVEVLEITDRYACFILSGVDVSFANALRRIMIAEVPCMAINEVVILDNTSPLFDEVLAHRLSLIPLVSDLDRFSFPDECDCGGVGCPKCQVTLILDVRADEGSRVVYSGDLSSSDPIVKPVSDKIPIAKLASNQRIFLEAYARLGRGKDGAKWQPVSACAYKYMPRINVFADKCIRCGDCIEACPRGVLEFNENGIPYLKDYLNCNLCRACEEICEVEAIKLNPDENCFIFYVESTGVLPISKIIELSARILVEKCSELIEILSFRGGEK